MVVQIGGHLRIQRGHDLVGTLDDGHLEPHFHEVLGHLQSDVASSGDDGSSDIITGHGLPHGLGILHRAKGHDTRIAYGSEIGDDGLRPGRENEDIVRLVIF